MDFLPLVKKKLKWIETHFQWAIIGLASCLFLLMTLPALVSDKHILFNLEPYPDGLVYTVPARNLVLTGHFIIGDRGQLLKPLVPPLYSLALLPGFLITSHPAVFYVINLILGLLQLIFLGLTLHHLTPKKLWLGVGMALYALNAWWWWLPTVPLAENLGVFLFILSIWWWTAPTWTQKTAYGLMATAVALAFTKYIYIGVAGLLALGVIGRLWQQRQWRQLSVVMGIGGIGGLLFVAFHVWNGMNPLGVFDWLFNKGQVQNPTYHGESFYSFKYIVPNTLAYVDILLGQTKQLLWLQEPLTSGWLTILGFAGLGVAGFYPKLRHKALALLLLFLAQWPLLIIFITVDARYALTNVIVVVLTIVVVGTYLTSKKAWLWLGLCLVGLFHLLWIQIPLTKQIISQNWLHRTRAWQYESIQVMNLTFQDKNEVQIITALPPFLVEMYQTEKYQTLPLSKNQEYLNKDKLIWDSEIGYGDLPFWFEQQLRAGQTLYITNAYITHSHEVVADFEGLKNRFVFETVATGCEHACDIYQLKLRPN